MSQRVRRFHAHDFFIALTSPALLDHVDEHLSAHRALLYPPIDTLSFFMAQTLLADPSYQAVVNAHSVARLIDG